MPYRSPIRDGIRESERIELKYPFRIHYTEVKREMSTKIESILVDHCCRAVCGAALRLPGYNIIKTAWTKEEEEAHETLVPFPHQAPAARGLQRGDRRGHAGSLTWV